MTKALANEVLKVFVEGGKISKAMLQEAVAIQLMPCSNNDLKEIPTKTTYFIATFEPNQKKRWVAIDDVRRILKIENTERQDY